MVVINSALWDAMEWYTEYGRRGWEECVAPPPPPSMRMQCSHDDLAGLLLCAYSGTTLSHKTHATVVAALHSDSMCCCICAMVIRENYNVPSTISNRIRAKTIYQVFEPG